MIKKIKFTLFVTCIGGIIGAFIWGFLRIMTIGQNLLFVKLPQVINTPYLILIICILGGLIIGIYEKLFKASPENLEVVMCKIKKEGKYPCDHIFIKGIGAVLPLIFGASIGPEAGLTGIIAGLCFWAGNKFRYAGRHIDELSKIGFGAALSAIFGSPLFGFSYSVEEDDSPENYKKSIRIVTYVIAILGGFGTFCLLNIVLGGSAGLPRLEAPAIGNRERIFSLVLIPVGIVSALLYSLLQKISSKLFNFIKGKSGVVFSAVLGGLCLGIMAMTIPFVQFSGEKEIEILAETYMKYTPLALIGIGITKLFITNICIESGWKGGHFFPIIFAGIAIGYGFGLLCSVDPVFASCVVTSALLGVSLKKPLTVVLLLILCFPGSTIVWMFTAAAAGAFVPYLFDKQTQKD